MKTWRISVFIFSICIPWQFLTGQDTIYVPLKVSFGGEVTGPVIYAAEKNTLNLEFHLSYDRSENTAISLNSGYSNYQYSQYNYEYIAKGIFARTGLDFNLLNPQKLNGLYYAGIGVHYGISRFTSEVSSFTTDNYWGPVTSSVPMRTSFAHFVEVTPGVRAEIFKNISIGWTISLRLLLSSGAGENLRPLYIPGFGNGSNRVNAAIGYFISWNIPYRTKRVIIQPEVEEEVTPDTGGSQLP